MTIQKVYTTLHAKIGIEFVELTHTQAILLCVNGAKLKYLGSQNLANLRKLCLDFYDTLHVHKIRYTSIYLNYIWY